MRAEMNPRAQRRFAYAVALVLLAVLWINALSGATYDFWSRSGTEATNTVALSY